MRPNPDAYAKPPAHTNDEAGALALQALAWTLAEDARAQRLLDVTGLEPTELRTRAGEPAVLAAALAFLEGHEPNLIACAEELGVQPGALVQARAALEA